LENWVFINGSYSMREIEGERFKNTYNCYTICENQTYSLVNPPMKVINAERKAQSYLQGAKNICSEEDKTQNRNINLARLYECIPDSFIRSIFKNLQICIQPHC